MHAMSIDTPATDDPGLTAALEGRAPIRVGALLRDGLEALRGAKRWVWFGLLAWLSSAVFAALLGVVLGLPDALAASVSVIATAPVSVALTMYGVRRVAGVPTDVNDLQAYRPALGHAVVVLLLGSLVLSVSDALLGPLWSLAVALPYSLLTGQALFLVADRGTDAFTAIGWSVRASLPVLPTLLAVQIVLAGLALVGVATLGIGLIWTGPLALLTLGAVSFRLFGTRAAAGRA
jgi:hypothetical protein